MEKESYEIPIQPSSVTCFVFVDTLEDQTGVFRCVAKRKYIFVDIFESVLVNDAIGTFLLECSVEKLHF